MPAYHDLASEWKASTTGPVYAIRAPRLLILLLLGRCNNRCRFCMVDEQIEASDDMPLETARQLIEGEPADTRIEFFGGEPTIYPHFYELFELARARGHRCSIATNGRAFASARFTARLAALGAPETYVRTSLYGADAATHDYYTRVPRSFCQTVRGIEHLVQYGFPCQVNVVMMRRNLDSLGRVVDLVAGLGVARSGFGMLVDHDKNQEHAVRLAELRKPLQEAANRALRLGLRVTIEKAPLCAAPTLVSHFACERQIAPVERAYALDGPCGRCSVSRWCPGLDPGYLARYGPQELQPLHKLPADQVRHINPDALGAFEPEEFRIHFFAWNPINLQDREILEQWVQLDIRIRERLGEMALIPPELIEPGIGLTQKAR